MDRLDGWLVFSNGGNLSRPRKIWKEGRGENGRMEERDGRGRTKERRSGERTGRQRQRGGRYNTENEEGVSERAPEGGAAKDLPPNRNRLVCRERDMEKTYI